MVKAKPFEVQTQHGTLSTTMLIQRWFQTKYFFWYRTLILIKWFEPFIGKMGISSFFHPMLNRRPMYYVMYKVRRIFWIWRKKKQLCWQFHIFFVWSEESSEYFGLGLVIRFNIFFLNMTRQERLGSLH